MPIVYDHSSENRGQDLGKSQPGEGAPEDGICAVLVSTPLRVLEAIVPRLW
jgi:hypothetical protein